MPKFIEVNQTVALGDQLKADGDPVVLVNTFAASPQRCRPRVRRLVGGCRAYEMQLGFISTQLHRGFAGSE